METFKELKIMLQRIGVFQRDSNLETMVLAKITNCVIFCISSVTIISSIFYLLFIDKLTRERTENIFEILFGILFSFWYLVFFQKKQAYADLFIELDAKINKRIADSGLAYKSAIYRTTNRKIETLTKNLLLLMRTASFCYGILDTAFCMFRYISTGNSNESLKQIYHAWYPFDWKSPIGFFGCFFIQLSSVYIFVEIYTCAIVLTVGFCSFLADFATDIEQKLLQLNEYVLELKGKKKLTVEERNELKKKMIDIFCFHSEAREFTIRFSNVNSNIVFACPIYTIAMFGSLAIQAKILLRLEDIFAILQVTASILGSLIPLFLFCHFGGNVTERFENVAKAVYELEWYEFPLDMQKDLQVMMAVAQKSIHIRGYGDTRSTHSVFKKILKNKFYYFVILRKF